MLRRGDTCGYNPLNLVMIGENTMAVNFKDSEILEFAISREIAANYLFLELAKQAEKPGLRKMFEKLAAEEMQHKAKLELEAAKSGIMMSQISETFEADMLDRLEQEARIKASAFKLDEDLKVSEDLEKILLLCAEKESDSRRLYIELAGIMKDKDSRDALKWLAKEEQKHKKRFGKEYEKLGKSN